MATGMLWGLPAFLKSLEVSQSGRFGSDLMISLMTEVKSRGLLLHPEDPGNFLKEAINAYKLMNLAQGWKAKEYGLEPGTKLNVACLSEPSSTLSGWLSVGRKACEAAFQLYPGHYWRRVVDANSGAEELASIRLIKVERRDNSIVNFPDTWKFVDQSLVSRIRAKLASPI